MPVLPDELWLSMLDNIYWKTEDFHTHLYRLCLVSKSFRSLFQPGLFRHFDDRGENAKVRPFLRTCLVRPDLAAAVKTMVILRFHEGWVQTNMTDWKYKQDGLTERLLYGGFSHHSTVLTLCMHMDSMHIACLFVLLCSLVPNIEAITLGFGSGPCDGIGKELQHARKYWALPTLMLAELRHLQILGPACRDGIDLRYYQPLCSLPGLRTLQVDNWWEDEKACACDAGPVANHTLEHIELKDIHLPPLRVRELIEGCHALKVLKIGYECRRQNDHPPVVDYGIIGSAVAGHVALLETLEISCCSDTRSDMLRGAMDLSQMQRLEHIDLAIVALLRFQKSFRHTTSLLERLPRSVKELALQDCSEHDAPALRGLVARFNAFPYLSQMYISTNFTDNQLERELEEGICSVSLLPTVGRQKIYLLEEHQKSRALLLGDDKKSVKKGDKKRREEISERCHERGIEYTGK